SMVDIVLKWLRTKRNSHGVHPVRALHRCVPETAGIGRKPSTVPIFHTGHVYFGFSRRFGTECPLRQRIAGFLKVRPIIVVIHSVVLIFASHLTTVCEP